MSTSRTSVAAASPWRAKSSGGNRVIAEPGEAVEPDMGNLMFTIVFKKPDAEVMSDLDATLAFAESDAAADVQGLDGHVGSERVPLEAVEGEHLPVHGASPSSSSLGR